MSRLEIDRLSVRLSAGSFGGAAADRLIVDDVSLRVESGETVALVGESGSGKSTILRAAMGLVRPAAGAVRLDGVDIAGLSARALRPHRRAMQMVFQDPYASLDPRQTAEAIVVEPLKIVEPRSTAASRRAAAKALLQEVGLPEEALDRYPHEFSGGQRQRLGIARALAVEPKILLLDEPVSALDVSVRAQVLNLLLDLRERRGLSYLFVSHDLGLVRLIARRVVVLYAGRVVEEGPSESVLGAPRHPYTRELLDAVPKIAAAGGRRHGQGQAAKRQPTVAGASGAQGCAFSPRCPEASARCIAERPELDGARPSSTACFHPLAVCREADDA